MQQHLPPQNGAHRARYPGQHWTTATPPDALGWSGVQLSGVLAFVRTLHTSALLAIAGGQVLLSYGETDRVIRLASIRKSLLSALVGIHVDAGHIALDATLARLGINDTEPGLTREEQQATVRDLLTSRSGVYHPANFQPEAHRPGWPARGSQAPGTFWIYNNWDFNAVGTIFEQCTGSRIFEEFNRRIAQLIGMQDFRVADQRYREGPDSVHPAYMFYLSARDLARYGLLYLRRGAWQDQRIVPEAWVVDSTRVQARTPTGPGFGYLWWVEHEGHLFGRLLLPPDSYASYGFGGQFLVIIPALDLVVVHLCHHDDPRSREGAPTLDELSRLLTMILAAHVPS